MRLKDDVFGPGIQPTVGIESCSKLVEVDGDQIVVSVPNIMSDFQPYFPPIEHGKEFSTHQSHDVKLTS